MNLKFLNPKGITAMITDIVLIVLVAFVMYQLGFFVSVSAFNVFVIVFAILFAIFHMIGDAIGIFKY